MKEYEKLIINGMVFIVVWTLVVVIWHYKCKQLDRDYDAMLKTYITHEPTPVEAEEGKKPKKGMW